jgi:hypothetical protein
VDPVPDPLLFRKSGSAGESNPEPLCLQPGSLATRPQRWSATRHHIPEDGILQNEIDSRICEQFAEAYLVEALRYKPEGR